MESFPFLRLPRELRDCIYAYVLQSKAEPPISPEDPTLSDRHDFDEAYGRKRGIMFEKSSLAYFTCCGLLCADRQISKEMHDIISRNGNIWQLDCMIQDHRLWPTWLSLPASPKYLRRVEVNLRAFSFKRSQWGSDGGPGEMVVLLLRLLGGFFEYGPRFLGRPLESPLHLESLVVSLVAVPAIPGRNEDSRPVWGHPALELMCRIFALQLKKIQSSGLLYGRVKMLKLRCEGRLDKEWAITDQGEHATWSAREWAPYGWVPGLKLGNNFLPLQAAKRS